MVKGIYHINVNVTNFERSLAILQVARFRVARDLGEGGNKYFERGLAHAASYRAGGLLQAEDDNRGTRIDLIEWKSPKAEGKPYPHLWHVGIGRIALITDHLQELCDKVKAANMPGVEFFSEPQVIPKQNGQSSDSFICFTDPDGTVIELIQFG